MSDDIQYRVAQKGKVSAFKVGSVWRFRHADIDAQIGKRSKQDRTGEGT